MTCSLILIKRDGRQVLNQRWTQHAMGNSTRIQTGGLKKGKRERENKTIEDDCSPSPLRISSKPHGRASIWSEVAEGVFGAVSRRRPSVGEREGPMAAGVGGECTV